MSASLPLRASLSHECDAMIRYLLSTGRRCPPAVVAAVDGAGRGAQADLAVLVGAHGQLARLVAPATPATIRLLDEASQGESGRWSTFGTVKLVRQMMGVAIACVVLFVALSMSRYVGIGDTDVSHSSGARLLLNELFWMASAGLGASFAMLYQVNQFITDRTYDPAYAPSYWIKFLLGVIAGFILVALLPFPEPSAAVATGTPEETARTFTPPLVAMLGGFSASAVYGILTRLVEAVENLFAGSAREQAAARETAAVQRLSGEAAEAKLAVAGKLVQVQQQLASGGAPGDVAGRLQEVIDSLLPPAAAGSEPGEAAGEPRIPALALVGDAPAPEGAAPGGDAEPRG